MNSADALCRYSYYRSSINLHNLKYLHLALYILVNLHVRQLIEHATAYLAALDAKNNSTPIRD
jgi:hypothetical protein